MYDEVNGSHEDENQNHSHLYGTTPDPADSVIKETEHATSEAECEASETDSFSFTAKEAVSEAEGSMQGTENTVSESPEVENVTPEELQAEEMVQRQEDSKPASSFYHYTYDKSSDLNKEYINEDNSGSENQNRGMNDSKMYHYSQTEPEQDSSGSQNSGIKSTMKQKLLVSAAVALVFGIVGGAAFQATNYVGGKLTANETEVKIDSAGTVNNESTVTEGEVDANTVPISSSSADISQVAENCMSSIVAITTVSVQQVESMFYGTQEQEAEGSGSGIIVGQNDTELLIATNNHVVTGANTLSVCFTVDVDVEEEEDVRIVEGQIKGTDPDNDLAIVSVNLSDIPEEVKSQIKVIEIGDSDNLKVGQQVVAIGNALGYGQSVTVGYVSALNREVTVDDVTSNLIQTDAAINFGNSGGALLNTNGQLIGINSVKAAATGVEGMGYAIPINTASPILSDLMDRTTRNKVDSTERGYMGVELADVSDEAKEIYSMPSGAFVYSVEEGGAAEAAGIKKGDIITEFDGVTISSRSEMLSRIEYYAAGEEIDVVVQSASDGEYQERTVTMKLNNRPADSSDSSSSSDQLEQAPYNNNEGNSQDDGDSSISPYEGLLPDQNGYDE